MDQDEFRDHVLSGQRDDYVSERALEYLSGLPVSVRESEGMGDPARGTGHTLISISLSGSNDFSEDELEARVRDRLVDGNRDIRKLNVTDGDDVATGILIISADYGYEAVAEF